MLASFGYLKYTIYISYFTPHFPRHDAEILMSLYPSMGVKYVSSPQVLLCTPQMAQWNFRYI